MKRLLSLEPFLTEHGYIGLARKGSSVGNETWVIAGCRTPILLSRQEENQSQYQVKGEVLLDGFMFGELQRSGLDATGNSPRRVVLV